MMILEDDLRHQILDGFSDVDKVVGDTLGVLRQ